MVDFRKKLLGLAGAGCCLRRYGKRPGNFGLQQRTTVSRSDVHQGRRSD